jgi:hypothetical protein
MERSGQWMANVADHEGLTFSAKTPVGGPGQAGRLYSTQPIPQVSCIASPKLGVNSDHLMGLGIGIFSRRLDTS